MNREEYCKICYEGQIVKGQCLEVASRSMGAYTDYNKGEYENLLFERAKSIFEEAKKQNLLAW